MLHIVYSPKPKITTGELAEVLKVFAYMMQPYKTPEGLQKTYDSLSKGAQRHFTLVKDDE